MNGTKEQDQTVKLLVEKIELPDSAYDAAKRRYDDLGSWFGRDSCTLLGNDPHIHVQGSFALGTGIVPVKQGEEYDLDLTCKLRKGVSRSTHTQRALKDLIGAELRAYRIARNIDKPLEPKNRCWRLGYKDELPFHMDVVPSIPAGISERANLTLLMEQRGMPRTLAAQIADSAVWITDQRLLSFNHISDDWPSSNPEGYVQWFVSRMRDITSRILLRDAQVDEVPLYRRKTPLQRAIQLLKAHRDVMFSDAPDSKPISIIITTLAAWAYVPGESLSASLQRILVALDQFRVSNSDEVLNPVNPAENFADKWLSPECRRLQLKQQFHNWVLQVNVDFQYFLTERSPQALTKRAESKFKVRLDERAVAAALNLATPSIAAVSPREVRIESAAKPWARE